MVRTVGLLNNPEQTLVADLRGLIDAARVNVAQAVNSALTLLHWKIGDRIHRELLLGQRAGYGEEILPTLSAKLLPEYGQGFSARNLARMVQFAETFPGEQMVAALARERAAHGLLPHQTSTAGEQE